RPPLMAIAETVPGDGDAESYRAGGNVSIARGAARPLPVARAGALSRGGRRTPDHAACASPRTRGTGAARRARSATQPVRHLHRTRAGPGPAHGRRAR